MAKGQARSNKEKKKPKSDKDKPKALSPYKAAQMGYGTPTVGPLSSGIKKS